jgi:hypothetical protein
VVIRATKNEICLLQQLNRRGRRKGIRGGIYAAQL